MYARIEVATRPEFEDPHAEGLLRKLQLAHPTIRSRIRWARWVDVYWVKSAALTRSFSDLVDEIFIDPVLQFSDPVARLLDSAPRASDVHGIEKRFRPGVTDNVARTAREALEIVLGQSLGDDAQVASGGIFLFTGDLSSDQRAQIARDILCNELIESWRDLDQGALQSKDRFSEEVIRSDIPAVHAAGTAVVERIVLNHLDDRGLEALSREKTWALSLPEMKAIRDHFRIAGVDPTDVEMEVIAQTWSEHCKHKIFAAQINYRSRDVDPIDPGSKIPAEIDSLFKSTVSGTTASIPRPWLLSVFSDNAGIIAFDDEDAFCIKVETHNSPSALDPYGGALTGIVGVNRDILGCGLGAKPVFNTNVFCVAPPDYSEKLPDRLLHPRRILEGIRRGVEHGGNKSGIPTVNGALYFDPRYLGKPLVYCGTGGFMPRHSAGRPCELKEIHVGDRICMVGGRIGIDGIHGATFSSLALDDSAPATAVQLGDPITQKRASDFLLEARDRGLYRAVTDNGAGGLSSSVGELAGLSGGARMDVALARTKYPGLRPYELVVSESQERMTVAVPSESMTEFLALAQKRGVEVSDIGEFTGTGRFEILYRGDPVANLDLEFLHKGVPRLNLQAEWAGRPARYEHSSRLSGPAPSFVQEGGRVLGALLSRNNIASKEWLIRQYDHEVQGGSIIKPLHQVGTGPDSRSGPNDAGVILPKPGSKAGIAVGCGLAPRLSDVDPWRMAEAAVDEAVRNVLCVGAEFGSESSVLALVDNFCWPDPVSESTKAAALVRACFGMKHAALKLQAPFVSGKDSMKNDFRGKLEGKDVQISVPPTLLVTAVARVRDTATARSADLKGEGDFIYWLSPARPGLGRSELEVSAVLSGWLNSAHRVPIGEPDWDRALPLYCWLGGARGSHQEALRSLHDVSEGGLLVALAESCIARGWGVDIRLTGNEEDLWEQAFGEGFHSFVASVREKDSSLIEREWESLGIRFECLGRVTSDSLFRVRTAGGEFIVPTRVLWSSWKKEGYWQ